MDRGYVIPLRCDKCGGVYDFWNELVKRTEGKAITGDENLCESCRMKELFENGIEIEIEIDMPKLEK